MTPTTLIIRRALILFAAISFGLAAPGLATAQLLPGEAAFEAARERGDVQAMREAMAELEGTIPPENMARLLGATAYTIVLGRPGPRGLLEARELADEAIALAPDDVELYLVRGDAEIAADDLDAARQTVAHVISVAPDNYDAHTMAAIIAGNAGEWQEAREALERSHALGLSQEVYDDISAQIDDAAPFYNGWGLYGVWAAKAAAGWAALFLLLLALGTLLSRAALRAARSLPTDPTADATPRAARLRALYAAVLWASCGFYYLSLPLVLIAVVGLSAGFIVAVFAAGYVPVKLVALAGVVALVTIGAVAKSIFIRAKDEDPGPELDLAAHPELARALVEVATALGTTPVHRVYLTPGADVAVFERGDIGDQLRGGAERCLVLGVAALEGLDQRAFKAILAHEYGHFVNRDTAGGGFALAVRRSLTKMAQSLAEGGAAGWYNPAWLFLNAFHRVFLRISQGASRLQEVLADRWAAVTYGGRAFERGLRHVIARSIEFDVHANATLREVMNEKVALSNFYTYAPGERATAADVEAAIEDAVTREASPYDSHPAPAERFELVHGLDIEETASEEDSLPVWSLFTDRAAIETMMTEEIRKNVLSSTGVLIPAQVDPTAGGDVVTAA